jgi:hypothetical protein
LKSLLESIKIGAEAAIAYYFSGMHVSELFLALFFCPFFPLYWGMKYCIVSSNLKEQGFKEKGSVPQFF